MILIGSILCKGVISLIAWILREYGTDPLVAHSREFPIGQINNDGNERKQKEVYIGYRYYSEEEGHKTDEEGRKFVGWSNKYDAWINNASPTL
jgi:hypothetical protein